MAISTITSAGIADNAVTAAKIVAGAVVADVGTDGITANEIVAGAVGSSEIAANAVGSSELADDAVLPANIAYLGDGTGNLSGTITGQQLHFGTAFTLTDDLTINGDVTLAKVRDDGTGQTLTHTASTARTLTGTGTLRMGHATEKTSISGLTGVLDPAVTGERIAQAWVEFDGTGTIAILSSFNISSLTDNGTGTYSIHFSITMASARYCQIDGVQGSMDGDGVKAGMLQAGQTATYCKIRCVMPGDTYFDADRICVAIFGDKA